MVNSSPDVLDGLRVLIIPKITAAVRDTLVAEVGTIIYNLNTNKLNFCKAKAAAAASWEAVTSA
jgi:hypothetical protein